jgi:dUTP diphosphatase
MADDRSGRRRSPMRTVVVERIDGASEVPLPLRATDGSACFDLRASERTVLEPGRVQLVPTGLRMTAPKGTFLEVRPRSGLSTKGVLMVNAPGTVDRDFSGEVRVPLTYLFPGTYVIEAGDRIAQVRLVEDHPAEFVEGSVVPSPSRRGGFGSTGR